VTLREPVATTVVEQEFYNPNDRTLEGIYLFPVPAGAQLEQFTMEVGGKQVAAELLPADQARKLYEDIVRQQRDPALLEYIGRDLFKVRIFPLEPRSRKPIKLRYSQLLRADSGLTSYLYSLNTTKFSAAPIPSVSLKLDLETRRPLKSIYSPSHRVEITRSGDRRASVGFEQKDLKPDTDFQLLFATEAGDIGLNLLTAHPPGEDGYFLLLASPGFEADAKRVVPKDVVFVLDTSGSMAGRKLEQAKNALRFCVENLNDGDRFELVRFSTEAEPLFNGLKEAGRAERDRALAFIQDLRPIGGTAIHEALQRALALLPAGSDRPRTVIFLTDGLPTVGESNVDRIVDDTVRKAREAGGQTRIFCFGIGNDVNTHLLDRITEATHAASDYVLPDEDLEVKVSRFFTKVKDPVLAGVELTFPESVKAARLYPSPVPDLFRGEQLVLVGRYAADGEGKVLLEGKVNGDRRRFEFDASFGKAAEGHEFIPRLWATRRIGHLLEQIRLHGESSELKDEVVQLARKHGLVTPYTAFLILEDEERRGVPLARQSLPELRRNRAEYDAFRGAFAPTQVSSSGPAAVAAARYGLSQKSADQVGIALSAGGAEADRMLAATAAPAAVPATAPVLTGPRPSGVVGSPAPMQRLRPVGFDAAQQSRFVGGQTFFQQGTQWVDARLQQASPTRSVRVQFNSDPYFELVADHPEARPWLALGQNVQFLLGETRYEIHE
jgi:Ca-activated chloride channel family protein